MSADLQAQLRLVFRDEAAELLGELRHILGLLRGAEGEGVEQHVSAALRLAHNLKGAAGNVGLARTERAAHALEEAFLKLRVAERAVVAEGLPLIGAALSAIELAAEGKGETLVAAHEELLMGWVGLPLAPHAEPAAESGKRALRASAPQPAIEDALLDEPLLSPEFTGTAASSKARTVRIEAERLDRLSEFVSALLVSETDMRRRHGLLETFRERLEVGTTAGPDEIKRSLRAALRALDAMVQDNRQALGTFARLSQDLHGAMKRARMVPLESLASSLQRTVEEAGRSVNKSIDLEFQLQNVELDKLVLDALRDPLMHLLRNAVDHGIEPAQTRELVGKPERGLIRISAEVVGSAVCVVVADDGRGIDLPRVARMLVTRGLVTAAQAARLDDAKLLDFIFTEGFSTHAQATQLSGRGVGLDVVRRGMMELGGSVRASPRGALGGAAFALTVPISLLSSRMLLVTANDCVYAVPAESVERVMRVPKQALRVVQGMHVAQLSTAESLRVVWLASALTGRPTREREHANVLVISREGARFALAVDEVLQSEELVIRRLPWNFTGVAGVSGAAVLADGTVAVVVDAGYLATGERGARVEPQQPRTALSRILVVDDSMTTRTLHRNVLSFAGYQVTTAHDGSEAWELLQRQAFDALVSDVQMPGLDGFELTRKVRADPHVRGLKVILVTSLDAPEDLRRGMQAGADEYVIKGPLERDALLSAVTKHLA